ncbi:MAG: serine/threonine protein kinase [Acidobacteria bacterium]|nr:serine/threonine protein kinase [Acidobacteriota bacterium]
MEQERFEQIDRILEAVLRLEAEAQDAFLTEVCAGDGELRREVELLLKQQTLAWKLERPAIAYLPEAFGKPLNAISEGQRINQYLIKERIGVGGMGEVWRAEDTRLKRDVAIKVLPPEFSADPKRVLRFEREAYAVSRLNHSNIVTIHDVGMVAGEQGELNFIVTELIKGKTLRALLNARRLGWRESVLIAAQVASALNAAHSVNIIHRDIKPENIMVLDHDSKVPGKVRHVKVLDFGIAKLGWGDGGAERLKEGEIEGSRAIAPFRRPSVPPSTFTVPGTLVGTPRYMSPEQVRGEDLDGRTDIFSFGIVLYEMIAGQHPYDGKSDEEILAALKSDEEIPPVSTLKADIPAALDRLIAHAIRKRREDRYTSVAEMQTDIEHLKSLIRLSGEKRETRQLREQNADQLLTQYVVFHETDPHTRIPLGALLGILRFASLKRGQPERALIRQSLVSGLAKNGRVVLPFVLVTMLIAAWLSVTETWAEQVMRGGHMAPVRCATFSPNGNRLVSGDEEGQVIVWEFPSRQKLGTLKAHTAWVTSIAFSPDGLRFATSGDDHNIIVWDTTRLEKVIELREHQWAVVSVVFSPDGRMLASTSGGQPGRTIVWDTAAWQKKIELPLTFTRGKLSFFANGWLLSSSTQQVWDLDTGREVTGVLDPAWSGEEMALSAQSNRLVTINRQHAIFFIDLKRRQVLGQRNADYYIGDPLAISCDGRLAASGSGDIALWDVRAQRKLARLKHSTQVKNLTFSPDGNWLVSAHDDGALLLWDVSKPDEVDTHELVANFNEHSDSVQTVAWADDGKRFASAGSDHSVVIWDAVANRKEAVLLGHQAAVAAATFSPDGKLLASAGHNGRIIVWGTTHWNQLFSITPTYQEAGTNICLGFSPDGYLIATGHGVYETRGGQKIADFTAILSTHGFLSALSFSRDGRLLAGVVSNYGKILLWDAIQWRLLTQLDVVHLQLTSVAFSPDGQQLVTGENEFGVRLWQVAPLRELGLLGRHDGRVKSVAFSPDGLQVVSAGSDKVIALWNVASRQLVTRIGLHTAPVNAVDFSPNGQQLLSGGDDHSVRLYTRHRSTWGWPWD